MAELSISVFERNNCVSTCDETDLPKFPLPAGQWLWLDVSGDIDAATISLLHDWLEISTLAIQDASRTRHPPKLELLDNFTFLLLREIVQRKDGDDPDLSQVSLFVNDHVLVTIHKPASAVVNLARQRIDKKIGPSVKGPAQAAYALCREIADAAEPVILAHEEALASIEDAIFDYADDSALEALSGLNRILRRLRRILSYEAVVFERLQRRVQEKVVPFGKHETTDLYENIDRLATLCQLNQELAVDLLNTHLGIASHRLNVVMRVLTVATIIFLPLGILAGIYGMNFQNMPELGWKYGYFAVLGTMSALAFGLVTYFKLKRWL